MNGRDIDASLRGLQRAAARFLIRAGQRNAEREGRSLAKLAGNPDGATEALQDLAADRQTEPGALRLVGQRVAGLLEALEYLLLIGRGDADAVVLDVHAQETRLLPGFEADPAILLSGELHGVRHQVDDDLRQSIRIGPDRRKIVGDLD